jgi:hypothetical protein
MSTWQFEYPCSGILVESRNAVSSHRLSFRVLITPSGSYELAYKADIEWVVFTCEYPYSVIKLLI